MEDFGCMDMTLDTKSEKDSFSACDSGEIKDGYWDWTWETDNKSLFLRGKRGWKHPIFVFFCGFGVLYSIGGLMPLALS